MRFCYVLFALSLVVPVTAMAAAPMPPARLGLCAACHGTDGHARIPGAPNLAGQSVQYLVQALHEYRDGTRRVAVMQTAAGSLSEADVQALARWYAAQSPCPPAKAGHP
ncbi:MAG TPA: cytochrome c [Rhodanobacteraceae bacterium]